MSTANTTNRLRDPETGRFVSASHATQSTNGDGGESATSTMVVQASDLLDRLRYGQRAGKQYNDDRKIYDVTGYVPQGELRFAHYQAKYDRDGIARRIVDMPAQTTWRNPPDMHEQDAEGEAIKDETPWSAAANDMIERLKLWNMFERVDRMAGIGRFGLLLIGERGVPDTGLREPLGRMRGPEDVIYLRAFSEGSVEKIEKWITDTGDPRYGSPEIYQIQLSAGIENFPNVTASIHHTRVIHVAEDLLEDEVYGQPRLKPVMNDLDDLLKVRAATAEGYWQIADRLLMLSIDPKAKVSGAQRKALADAVGEIFHDLRRFMVSQGLGAEWLSGQTPQPMEAARLYMMLLGAARGIPFRILFGNDTGERASQEDQKQWLGTVTERTERFASPVILHQFFDRMIEHGALPRPRNGYVDVWPTLWETPEKEVAETDRLVAQTAKDLTPMGGDPSSLIEIDEDGRPKLIPMAAGESPFEPPDVEPGEIGPEQPEGEEEEPEEDEPEDLEEAA